MMGRPDSEELARMRDMMDALSTMIEQDRRGEDLDPTFDDFMEKFGDFFPGAENLEDVVRLRRNLGDDAARHVVRLQKALQGLKDQGFVDRQGRQLHLTPKGVRQIGQQALRDLFAQLRDSPTLGLHRVASVSRGGDREETSKPWEPGEPFALNLPKTLRNAVLSQGPGTPVKSEEHTS